MVFAFLQSPDYAQWSASDNYEAINTLCMCVCVRERLCVRLRRQKAARESIAADLRKCCHLFYGPTAPVPVLAMQARKHQTYMFAPRLLLCGCKGDGFPACTKLVWLLCGFFVQLLELSHTNRFSGAAPL